jgi:hypothetical protein
MNYELDIDGNYVVQYKFRPIVNESEYHNIFDGISRDDIFYVEEVTNKETLESSYFVHLKGNFSNFEILLHYIVPINFVVKGSAIYEYFNPVKKDEMKTGSWFSKFIK